MEVEEIGEDVGVDDAVIASAAPPPAPAPRRPAPRPLHVPRPAANTDIVREMANEDDRSVRDWIDSVAGESDIRVTITRKRPTLDDNGQHIAGALETVEDRIDEDYIREMWGGGDYQLKVQTPKANGGFKYFRGRTIRIAGPAKMNGKVVQAVGGHQAAELPRASLADNDTLADRAFMSMERHARESAERAERIEREARDRPAPGLDFAALQALQAPMIEQLRTAQETVAALQAQMLALATKPAPRDEFRDRIMESAISGEGKRVETLREQYEMRIDKLRDNFDDERKRLEDRHQAEIKRLEDRHERELKMYEKQSEASSKNADVANGARLDAAQETIKRLERELTAATAKIGALEAKKDQSIGEKADELIKVKEALDGLGGGDGDDKDAPWYRQVIDGIGNSEAAMTWISKLTGGAPAEQQNQPQQQLPPPGIPFQTGDGNVYVRDGNGQTRMIDPATANKMAARARKRARRAAQAPGQDPGVAAAAESEAVTGEPSDAVLEAALAGEPVEPPVKVRKPSKKEIDAAVQFAESALRNGDADEKIIGFASTARNLMPGDVLAYIQSVGSDTFITDAKLPAGSPLTTIRGRQFLRKVFKVIVEGSL